MTEKEKKAEYDRKRRLLKKDEIKAKKKAYNESPAGRAMQKRAREKKCQKKHNEYCKLPEQRQKERLRRRKRTGTDQLKYCLCCNSFKQKIEFQSARIFPDGYYYLCRECEKESFKTTNQSTRSAIQAIVTLSDGKLTRQDVAKYPYFVECKKYLISLNKYLKL